MTGLADRIAARGLGGRARLHTPPALGDGLVYVCGAAGDLVLDGGAMLDVEISNRGTQDLWVGFGLTDAISGPERRAVPAASSKWVRGFVDQLVLHNDSGVDLDFDLTFLGSDRRHPGHGSFVFRVAEESGGVVEISRELTDAITVEGIAAYCATKRTSASGGYVLRVTGGGNNLLAAASFDLEGLTAGELGAASLTATAAHLDLGPDDAIEIEVESDEDDLTEGDLVVEVLWRLR